MKHYPAIDFAGAEPDLLAAAVDDFAPTAIEQRGTVTRVFFADAAARDAALQALAGSFRGDAVDVGDDDWARRSQQELPPITVGRLTIVADPGSRSPIPILKSPRPVLIIRPSMGFGTGHHATTRLCLRALQTIAVTGKLVLDVGTGSGILAIAAARLGAARAIGIDSDPDAVAAACENLELNQPLEHVEFAVADLTSAPLPSADVITANLTGALLVRSAPLLLAALLPGGSLIVSGLQFPERGEVLEALLSKTATVPVWESVEDDWVALAVKKP